MKLNWIKSLRDRIFGINKLEYRIVKRSSQYSELKFKELKALEILKPYFPKGFVFETSYTLSFQAIQHIANDIIINRPQTILEIGSGLSTIILSNIIKELPYKIEFISIDQDSNWQNHLKPHCSNVDFHAYKLISNSEFCLDGSKWFDIPKDSLLRRKKFDLVIIDGPKGSESRFARFGIVNFLKNRITESSIIFLDDTNRDDEKFILKNLKSSLSLKNCNSYQKYSRLSNEDLIITSPS